MDAKSILAFDAPDAPLDRRLMIIAEQIAGMANAGELNTLESDTRRDLEALPMALLDIAGGVANPARAKGATTKLVTLAINRAAQAAIVLAMSEAHSGNAEEADAIGRAVVAAIARGEVPHVNITIEAAK